MTMAMYDCHYVKGLVLIGVQHYSNVDWILRESGALLRKRITHYSVYLSSGEKLTKAVLLGRDLKWLEFYPEYNCCLCANSLLRNKARIR